MDCKEFQRIIPDIVNNRIRPEHMKDVVTHVHSCKDCYDELEINYVLDYGLSEDERERESLNFVALLEDDIERMEVQAMSHHFFYSLYILIMISSAVAVVGSLIYVVFKIWFPG